jgi:hypothetical protein
MSAPIFRRVALACGFPAARGLAALAAKGEFLDKITSKRTDMGHSLNQQSRHVSFAHRKFGSDRAH